MNDLMTHVESIVRPIRARQSWKLRTRRELLAHLQSSYDEELSRGPDPAAALTRAKSRLGDPADLTPTLPLAATRPHPRESNGARSISPHPVHKSRPATSHPALAGHSLSRGTPTARQPAPVPHAPRIAFGVAP